MKTMEELGIGRPSTYATILGTIVDRGYAWRKGSALVPTWIAFAVVNLLEEHFARLVDYQFTSSVEDDLDEIAAGSRDRAEWLTRFYFGSPEGREGGMARAGGLKRMVEEPARRHRRPRDQLDPDRRGPRRRADHGPGRSLRPVHLRTATARPPSGRASPRTCRRTS